MRQYELMVILDPETEERTVGTTMDKFLSVVKKDWWHRRQRRRLGPSPARLRHQEEERGHLRRRQLPRRPRHGSGARPPAEPQRVGHADRLLRPGA